MAITFNLAAIQLRVQLGLSQKAMARLTGLSIGAVRNYENTAVKTPNVRALAAYVMAAKNARYADPWKMMAKKQRGEIKKLEAFFGHLLQDALGHKLSKLAKPSSAVKNGTP